MTRQTLSDCLGWCGAFMLLTAYAMFSFSLLAAGVHYSLLNLFGALAVGQAALFKKSYPAAFVEFAWAAIALCAIIINLRR